GRNQAFVFQQHFASLYQHVVIDIVFAHDGCASIPGRHCLADITAADIIVLERQGYSCNTVPIVHIPVTGASPHYRRAGLP
ncbi:hypothetical protein, partial [Klebsiella pneumoniae]|uniref:hypothetical protein n=1 Tax=Klebsiella pneumoniae TaxID=573 RepID=UPI001965F9DB